MTDKKKLIIAKQYLQDSQDCYRSAMNLILSLQPQYRKAIMNEVTSNQIEADAHIIFLSDLINETLKDEHLY
jgi:hypothetical protein